MIEVYSDDFITKYTDGSHGIDIYFYPLPDLYFSGNTMNGNLDFEDLSVNAQGNFKLKAVSSGFIDGFSEEFVIINIYACPKFTSNIVKYIQPHTTEDIFSVVVELFNNNDCSSLITSGAYDISLSISSPSIVLGITSGITSNGSLIFSSLQFQTEGNFDLEALGAKLFSIIMANIVIKNYYIKIAFQDEIVKIIQPYYKTCPFAVSVQVFSNSDKTILETTERFEINLVLNPVGSLIGTTSGLTTNGLIIFSNIQITTMNNYTLLASGDGIITEASYEFEINNIPSAGL